MGCFGSRPGCVSPSAEAAAAQKQQKRTDKASFRQKARAMNVSVKGKSGQAIVLRFRRRPAAIRFRETEKMQPADSFLLTISSTGVCSSWLSGGGARYGRQVGKERRGHSGNAGHAHSEDAGARADARLWNLGAHRAVEQRRFQSERGFTVCGAAAARARWARPRRVEGDGKQPTGQVLRFDRTGKKETAERNARMGAASERDRADPRSFLIPASSAGGPAAIHERSLEPR